jgi:TRAP-type mannitol/chloroaromatic compound transport system permease small subunit
MRVLLAISAAIDRITAIVGRSVRWLILAAILVSAANAVTRKAFDMSSNAWLELQWYLFGAAFMLAAAYTLQKNDHIRIDILSSRLSKRTRDWIDLACHFLMLLPFLLVMTWLSIPFALDSFVSGEGSANAGGLVVWPAKAFLLVGFLLLLAQAFSEIVKRIAILAGKIAEPNPPQTLPPAIAQEIETAKENRDD